MNELLEKEKRLLSEPIKVFLEGYLLDSFKNRKGQPVIKVDGFTALNISIDEDQSEIKERFIITGVSFYAHVWVSLGADGSTNNTLNLSTTKGMVLYYNFEEKKYTIENIEGISLLDKTF